ncbi:unnamed protein product [Sphagnum jensenii]|uniref:RRM domain-containing protein n=1 Tax=Sphagnum jensenii TaxID=128206 RepID=A0ABP1AGX5_9BRYO
MDPGSRTHPGYSNPPSAMMQHLDSLQHAWSLNNQDWSKRSPRSGTQNLDQWGVVGRERMLSGNSSYSWSNTSDLSGMRELTGLSSSPLLNGNLENLESYAGGIDARNLSTTFPAIFSDKLRLSVSDAGVGQSLDNSASHIIGDLEGDDTFSSLQELELHTIGNLLPDDEEELLAGVTDDFDCIVSLNNAEETEDFDLFSSGGGMELEGDSQDAMGLYVSGHRGGDSMLGGAAGQQGAANAAGSVAGEHPYGEHPSRTLFVRNINSNVEDTELRTLFEEYGAIRTLYTACKHRGFVMISYYDIRAARSAMRALQNKPLRRRKLDIHFSIPKDNPSDKDVNQGTLVVFNLDASVSNDDLRHIFGGYGEVKEIRETPHKRHHKFIEFYDVRAAEAALRALNRSDIAGKRIKLEPSRPGGAQRSLLQQLSQDLDPDDSQPIRQQSHSPLNSSPPGHPAIWGSVSSTVENGSLRGMHQSLPLGSFQTLGSMPLSGSVSLPPHISSPIRVGTIGSHVAQSTQMEAGHSLGNLGLGHRLPPHHPQSLPEYGKVLGVSSTGPYLFPSSSSNGNGSLSGNQFLWGNPSPYHQQTQSSPLVSWPNTSSAQSFSHNGQIQLQSNAYSASQGTLMNTILARHHVGSAPSGEPSPIERRQSYLGESPESSSLMGSASGGSMGMIGHSGAHAINIGGSHGLMNLGPALEHSSSSPSLSVMSPQQRARVFVNGGLLGPVSGSMEGLSDHGRGRRGESLTAQAENKKQYQLDLDRILRGEDPRTTLMIKNIPNKYTSKMLLAAIDENHRGTYDFIYLPIDFKNKCNVGYAFINMIAPSCIVTFYQAFNGKKWEKFNSEKVASLAYARIQGKAALVAHFQNSSLMNEDKRCRPILFHSEGPHVGDQEPFPMGADVRIGGSHQGSPSTSNSSRDGSVQGVISGGGAFMHTLSPDRDKE